MKISVIVKEPGKRPRHVHIENSLENLQKTVGGYIETVPVKCFDKQGNAHRVEMIVNEEGKLLGLPMNFAIVQGKGRARDVICGTAVFCGEVGEEFADLPVSFSEFKGGFPELWMCQ